MTAGSGYLYDCEMRPVGKAPPFYSPEGLMPLAKVGQVLCVADPPAAWGLARIWVLPPEGVRLPLTRRITSELVAALDFDLAVGILGSQIDQVWIAAAGLMSMVEDLNA